MRATFALCFALALAGCQAVPGAAIGQQDAPAPTVRAIKQVCIPVKPWSGADQDLMQREFDALAPNAIMRDVFRDYVAMRDASRACASAQR